MGVHIRGTIQRIVRRHSLPPNPKDILLVCNKLFIKYKCDKIFQNLKLTPIYEKSR